MKIRVIIVTLFLMAFAFAPAKLNAQSQNGYSAKLISPTLGQVLHPGEQFKIEWTASLPKTTAHLCEMELRLSLDGGRTFSTWITTELPPKTRYFDWTVPNTPTNAAVLSVNFGCELYYPETFSPQPASTFVIAAH